MSVLRFFLYLRILKVQYSDINIDKWKVLRFREVSNGRVFITIVIDKVGLLALKIKSLH